MTGSTRESATWREAYHSHRLARRRLRTHARKLRRLGILPDVPISHVLDVACGSGEALSILASSGSERLIGVDIDGPVVQSPAFRQVRGDAVALPFAAGTFQHVFCLHSLHHLRSSHALGAFLDEAEQEVEQTGGQAVKGSLR